MKRGALDLDPRNDYLLVYTDKTNDTINTWTLPKSGFIVNYDDMRNRYDTVNVYKKLNDDEIQKILNGQTDENEVSDCHLITQVSDRKINRLNAENELLRSLVDLSKEDLDKVLDVVNSIDKLNKVLQASKYLNKLLNNQ